MNQAYNSHSITSKTNLMSARAFTRTHAAFLSSCNVTTGVYYIEASEKNFKFAQNLGVIIISDTRSHISQNNFLTTDTHLSILQRFTFHPHNFLHRMSPSATLQPESLLSPKTLARNPPLFFFFFFTITCNLVWFSHFTPHLHTLLE